MVEVARTQCPTLVASATEECTKFITILSLLGQCHRIYDQNFIAEAQCRELSNFKHMATNEANIPFGHDPLKRLLLIVKEHLLIVAPHNVAAIPPPKRMK